MFTSTRSTGHRKPLARRVALRIGLLGMVGPVLACGFPALTESTNEAQAPQVEVEAQSATATPAPPGVLPTDTATPTSTAAPTATYFAPQFTSNVNANCRSGPGTVYDIIGSLPNGTTVPIIGKDSTGTWWYVAHVPACWVSSTTGTAEGDLASVPVLPSPPTPTPTYTPMPTYTSTPGIIIRPPITTWVVPFIPVVTSVNVTTDTPSYSGACPHRFYWHATASATGALTANWIWETSYDGVDWAETAWHGSITFSGAGSQTVPDYWFETSSDREIYARVHITAPGSLYSSGVGITINCTP